MCGGAPCPSAVRRAPAGRPAGCQSCWHEQPLFALPGCHAAGRRLLSLRPPGRCAPRRHLLMPVWHQLDAAARPAGRAGHGCGKGPARRRRRSTCVAQVLQALCACGQPPWRPPLCACRPRAAAPQGPRRGHAGQQPHGHPRRAQRRVRLLHRCVGLLAGQQPLGAAAAGTGGAAHGTGASRRGAVRGAAVHLWRAVR